VNEHDEEEFRQFVVARMDDLRAVAYLACGNWQTAEDAVSAALTKLYVNWKTIAAPHRYACRVVANAAIDEVRRPWRRERLAGEQVLDRVVPDRTEAFHERVRVRDVLRRVPPGQRTVLVLRFFADFSVDEVAEMLGKSPGTIKSQTARGLATLRELLAMQDAQAVFDVEEGNSDERCAPVVRDR
jgi:RNA polymerase sigma-70 factor (sigma-E family)